MSQSSSELRVAGAVAYRDFWLLPSYRFHRRFLRVRNWALRRFTPVGLLVLLGTVLAAMFGPDTDNNFAYQAFALFLALLLIAVGFTRSFRPRVTATRHLPQFGTVGTVLHYKLIFKSASSKAENGLTALEDVAEGLPSFHDWLALRRSEARRLRAFRLGQRTGSESFQPALAKETVVPLIPPGQQVSVSVELTPLRRGVLRLEGVFIARSDPFGLLRAFAHKALPQTVLILPKRYPVPALALPGTLKYQEGGVALAANVGQSDEFVALRDYRHGDPIRHIHWRSWAKAGKPVVKEFEDEFFVRHALVLDTFAEHPYSESFEEAVSVAASFACTIQTQESLLDLLFVGPHSYCFTAGRGLAHTDQLLEVLASVRPCLDQPFSTLQHLVLNHIHAVSGCVCVLLAWDAARQELVSKLKVLGVPVRVLLVLQPEQAGPRDTALFDDEPGRFSVLRVGDIERDLAQLAV